MTASSFLITIFNVGNARAAAGGEAVGADRGAIQAVGELGILGSACVYSSGRRHFSLFGGDHRPSHITCINLSHSGWHCCSVPLRILVVWVHSPGDEVA